MRRDFPALLALPCAALLGLPSAALLALPCAALLALLGACAPADAGVEAAGSRALIFRGEVVVRGLPKGSAVGAVSLAAVPPGGGAPCLERSWLLADPAWRAYGRDRRLYFQLDERDRVADGPEPDAGPWELLARWDPDGNPATGEPGVAFARAAAVAGAETEIDLAAGRELASASEPAHVNGGG
jgi:hypothetical protein